MYPSIKRTALSLCLAASIATPVWAGDATPVTDPSVIMAPIAAPDYKEVPSKVTVDGKTVTFGQGPVMIPPVMTERGPLLVHPVRDEGPVMVDGVLFVPVRAIAEAAGGVVTWDDATRLVHVRMPGRTITIQLDHQAAEMHEDGVSYFTRNLIQMKKLPLLMGARTVVSADALTTIFGFQATSQADGTLALTSPGKPAVAPADPVARGAEPERGTVSQVEEGRFLLSGAAMANDEPRLTWASITKETKITVIDGDQQRDGSLKDIAPGAEVKVYWAGPLLESYPARGAAAEVLVTANTPAAAPEEPAAPAADIEQGTVSRWETDVHNRFLLAGGPMSNGEPTLSWVAITAKTKITVREGDQTRAGSVSDITEGAQVAVTWDGMRAMSYPAQGAAAEVVVQK